MAVVNCRSRTRRRGPAAPVKRRRDAAPDPAALDANASEPGCRDEASDAEPVRVSRRSAGGAAQVEANGARRRPRRTRTPLQPSGQPGVDRWSQIAARSGCRIGGSTGHSIAMSRRRPAPEPRSTGRDARSRCGDRSGARSSSRSESKTSNASSASTRRLNAALARRTIPSGTSSRT